MRASPAHIDSLNRYLAASIRAHIEREYYGKVEQQAKLDVLVNDPTFLTDPGRHLGLFSDHGVVHVRDVAAKVLQVLEHVDGVLIPGVDYIRHEGMKAVGVWLAYVHDIGMKDFTAFGRAMHPEYAAQQVFSPAFDEVIETLWEDNYGNLAWGFSGWAEEGVLQQSPKLLLREMLALAVGHSKSKVPMSALNEPALLRDVLVRAISVDLHHLYHEQRVDKTEQRLQRAQAAAASPNELDASAVAVQTARAEWEAFKQSDDAPDRSNTSAVTYYDDIGHEAYRWLLSDREELRLLARDAINVVRALRAADALRQRGTVLKTSGGYHISVDQKTAHAIYTLHKSSGETFLVESQDAIGAGESNIASSELSTEGDLWISFQRGYFLDDQTTDRAARHVAGIVDDIQRDIVDSFVFPAPDHPELKRGEDIQVRIESTDDNLDFAGLVKAHLQRISPALGARTRIVPSLKRVSVEERERYLAAQPFEWSMRQRELALARIAQTGHNIAGLDPGKAFDNVRIASLREGDVLFEAGSPHGFVYVPVSGEILATPQGGYQPFAVSAWSLVGRNSVIRGDVRGDTDVALSEVDVLMIPKETYLEHWHRTHQVDEFADVLTRFYPHDRHRQVAEMLAILGRVALVDGELHDEEVAFIENEAAVHGIAFASSELRDAMRADQPIDFSSLRDSVIELLATNPPFTHIARFRDLLHLLAIADDEVSEKERTILAELDQLLLEFLAIDSVTDDEKRSSVGQVRYRVLLVPQDAAQDAALRAALPELERLRLDWGVAYTHGVFLSEDYANLIRDRLRRRQIFAVVDREQPPLEPE